MHKSSALEKQEISSNNNDEFQFKICFFSFSLDGGKIILVLVHNHIYMHNSVNDLHQSYHFDSQECKIITGIWHLLPACKLLWLIEEDWLYLEMKRLCGLIQYTWRFNIPFGLELWSFPHIVKKNCFRSESQQQKLNKMHLSCFVFVFFFCLQTLKLF